MMNWFDLLLSVLVMYNTAGGWRYGLIRQLFDIVGIFIAYFIALNYGNTFTAWFTQYIPFERILPKWFSTPSPGGFSLDGVLVRLLGFIILFLIVRALVRVAAKMLHGVFSLPLLATVNGLGGMILGLIKGVFLAVIIVTVASLLSGQFWQQAIDGSILASSLLSWLPIVYNQMLDILLSGLMPTV